MLRNLLHRLNPARPRQRAIQVKVPEQQRGARPIHYLGLCAIVRNEARYIEEWLEFHFMQGVEHAVIYDNGSTDATSEILEAYQSRRLVTRIPWSHFCGRHNAQTLAYAHAIANFGGRFRWLAFLDADEFLFPIEAVSLLDVLTGFEQYPALAVYWSMFGTGSHMTEQPGLTIETYVRKTPYVTGAVPDHAVNQKSIVDPRQVQGVQGAHLFHIENMGQGAYLFDGTWLSKRRKNRLPPVPEGPLQLNHYFTRSRSEFETKTGRRIAPGPAFDVSQRNRDLFQWIERDTVEDHGILRFAPDLKLRLAQAGDRRLSGDQS